MKLYTIKEGRKLHWEYVQPSIKKVKEHLSMWDAARVTSGNFKIVPVELKEIKQ